MDKRGGEEKKGEKTKRCRRQLLIKGRRGKERGSSSTHLEEVSSLAKGKKGKKMRGG